LPGSVSSPSKSDDGQPVEAASFATTWVPALVIAAAFVALRAPFLHLPFYSDEVGYYVSYPLRLFNEGTGVRGLLQGLYGFTPGLPLLLLSFWSVAGFDIFATKLLATMIAAAAVIATGRAASVEAGPAAGAGAAALLASAPPFFFHGTTLVPEGVVTLLAALLLNRLKAPLGAAISCVATLFKPTGGILAIEPALSAWRAGGRQRLMRAAAMVVLPALILAAWWALPWLLPGTTVRLSTSGRLEDSEFFHALARLAKPSEIRVFLVMRVLQFFVFDYRWVATLALIVGLALAWQRRKSLPGTLLGAASVVVSYVLVHAVMGKYPLIRYLVPALPAFFLIVAVVSRVSLGRGAAAVVFIVCPLLFMKAHHQEHFYSAGGYTGMGGWDDHEHVRDVIRAYARAFRIAEAACPQATIVGSYPANAMAVEPGLGYVRRPHAQRLANVPQPPPLAGEPVIVILGDHFIPLPVWTRTVSYARHWTVRSGETSVFVGIPVGSTCPSSGGA
jgi:hypothetical protein